MSGWATALISILGTIIGAVLGVVSAMRVTKQTATDAGKTDGVMLTEIGYIKSSIDEIKGKLDKQDERYAELRERLAAVEASAKQAHKRLDESGVKR